MTEQSIREDLIAVIEKAEEDHFQSVMQWVSDRCPNPVPGHHREPVADAILASPVIRRIQAEALREAVRIFAEGEWVDTFIVESVQDDASAVVATDKWFNEYADDIEAGDD